jgi:hypothetical protein
MHRADDMAAPQNSYRVRLQPVLDPDPSILDLLAEDRIQTLLPGLLRSHFGLLLPQHLDIRPRLEEDAQAERLFPDCLCVGLEVRAERHKDSRSLPEPLQQLRIAGLDGRRSDEDGTAVVHVGGEDHGQVGGGERGRDLRHVINPWREAPQVALDAVGVAGTIERLDLGVRETLVGDPVAVYIFGNLTPWHWVVEPRGETVVQRLSAYRRS